MTENYIFTIKSLRPSIVNIIGDQINNYDYIYDNEQLLKISGGVVKPLRSRSPIPFDIIESEHIKDLNKKMKKNL